jgi:DNA invertase Pin-like site-specific DNA recombinase
MIEDARVGGDFKAILCWDRARFGRFDSIEYGYYVYPLREAGIHLATVTDGVTDWSEVSGRIVASVTQEGRHQQLLDHSGNVTRGQLGAMQAGGWVGSPPYGYRVEGPKKGKRLVVDDWNKMRVVQRIYREYVDGVDGRPPLSLRAIAARLNDEGYVSPSGKVKGWRWDAVRKILENPAYTGDFVGGRYAYGKYHRIKGGRVEKSGLFTRTTTRR